MKFILELPNGITVCRGSSMLRERFMRTSREI